MTKIKTNRMQGCAGWFFLYHVCLTSGDAACILLKNQRHMMSQQKILLTTIKTNPKNPRTVNEKQFEKLCRMVKAFPKMLALRPIVVDKSNMVLGGNMRLRALRKLGYTEVPREWVVCAEDLTKEEVDRFIIQDNVEVGDWDWDILANEWDEKALRNFGLSVPGGEWKEDTHMGDDVEYVVVIAKPDEADGIKKMVTGRQCKWMKVGEFKRWMAKHKGDK
jgi:ParB-like chromosome segregation protein Spo0J